MKYIAALLCIGVLFLTACDRKPDTVEVSDIYSFETPATFPAAAAFMTIVNGTDVDDRMIDFKTDYAGRVELHTMAMNGDVMRMRRVEGYDVAAGQTHSLKPGGDHIMFFGVKNPARAGEVFNGVAVFEKAGEIPVEVKVRDRSEMGNMTE